MPPKPLKLLGDFLRAKRERLQPEAIGLPKPRRTRAKGLRRDDVAEKAGISTIWYSKIERGQVSGISTQVINALSETLQLTKSERQYIGNLISLQARSLSEPCCNPSAHTSQLLTQLNPYPVVFMNDYLDLVSCNDAFTAMIGFFLDTLQSFEKNYLYLTITNENWRRFLCIDNQEKLSTQIVRMAGLLRNMLAKHPDDFVLEQKIIHFIELSSAFEAAWLGNTVQQVEEVSSVYEHAQLGRIKLDKQLWWNFNGDTSSRLNIYHPRNEDDKKRLFEVF
ncbi:helix-turn-helix domain-containing protein [Vibrio mimicus]